MNHPTSQGLVMGLSKGIGVLLLSLLLSSAVAHIAVAKTVGGSVKSNHPVQNSAPTPPPDDTGEFPGFERDTTTSITRNKDAATPTGSFNYNYAVTLAPGRASATPDLSLSYSSQAGSEYDVFGYGWGLSLPYIQRENYQGIDKLYGTSSPRFVSSLSGELASTSTSTLYTARNDYGAGLEYFFDGTSWTVVDKAGDTYFFGVSASTREDNPNNTSQVYKWMLEKKRDASGNYISYAYTKDDGQIYPSTITYTESENSGAPPGLFSVNFTLAPRASSTATSSATGFPVVNRYEVAQITSEVSGIANRKYDLTYGAGDNGTRLTLASITESDINEFGATTTLPATTFSYATSTPTWDLSDWSTPTEFVSDNKDGGVALADVNGDGLVDSVEAGDIDGNFGKLVRLKNNSDGWDDSPSWTASVPCAFFGDINASHLGAALADVNGDGLPDFICNHDVYLNTGSGWALNSNWYNPAIISNWGDTNLKDGGVRFVDVNGDGLSDIVQSFYYDATGNTHYYSKNVYLNNGSGWTLAPDWTVPVIFSSYGSGDRKVAVDDINGDGLADIITGYSSGDFPNTVYLGTGGGWATSTAWTVPIAPISYDTRILDFNGDGLLDIVQTDYAHQYGWGTNAVYINTGSGWTLDPELHMPFPLQQDGYDTGLRVADADADGSADFLIHGQGPNPNPFWYDEILLGHTSGTDLMNRVKTQTGSVTSVTYQSAKSYRDGNGNLLSPKLPANPFVLGKLDQFDGVAETTTSIYSYLNGFQYYANPFDRRQAGFGEVTQTDSGGNTIATFYHQGNDTATSSGEYNDNEAKIGKPYRVETADASGNLFTVQVNKWDSYARGGLASLVKLVQSTLLTYDGGSSHIDKAESYAYNDANGDLTERTEWGNVLAASDGSFTDMGSDKFVTDTSYAASSTNPLSLPDLVTTVDQSGNVVRKTTNYYDTLGFGSATKGNLTKQLQQISSTTSAETDTVYNSYGLPTQVTDPRGNSTTYAYDAYNLYPATTTDALGYTTTALYNYSIGKPKQTTNENGVTFTTVFDGLGRVLEQDEPDPLDASSSVPKVQYVYTDTGMPRSVQETDYLGSSTSAVSYTYLDGLGRTLQKLTEAEGSNTYNSVVDAYDSRGLLHSESLPYTVNSSGFSALSNPPPSSLLTTYVYDPLQRVLSATTHVGATTNSYNLWKTTITDANGHSKDYLSDPYGNLVEVDEHNDDGIYKTYYAYDGNNNLTQLTDANGNVRHFVYDELSRRTSAEDLHTPGAGTFGTWTYTYDAAGNVTKQKDPKNKTVNYTFDALNRVLTEKLAGLTTGTTTGGSDADITYQYDSCAYGKMHLCTASTTDALTAYTYTPLGMQASETETIRGIPFTTSYTYNRLGNKRFITYPDASQVRYSYNDAGLLESISQKPSDGTFTPIVQDFDYAPNGKVSYELFGNGVATTNTYDPDQLYRLTNILTIGSTTPGGQPESEQLQKGIELSTKDQNEQSSTGGLGTSSPTTSTSTPMLESSMSTTSDATSGVSLTQVLIDLSFDVASTTDASAGPEVTPDVSESTDNSPVLNVATSTDGDIRDLHATSTPIKVGNSTPNDAPSVATSTVASTTTPAPQADESPGLLVAGLAIQNITYAYDAVGNITSIADYSANTAAHVATFTYDYLNRLKSASTTAASTTPYAQTYTYDKVGNITNKSDLGAYSYTGANNANPDAPNTIGSATLKYDKNGNITNYGAVTYGWDYRNRLTSDGSGTATSTYGYDYQNNRVIKTNATTTTSYPNDLYSTAGGSSARRYVFSTDGTLVATIKGAATSTSVFTIHPDILGSTNVITDASGTLTGVTDYYPYGTERTDTGTSVLRKFIGEDYDTDTSLSYLNARYYDGTRGQFLSQDPQFLGTKQNLQDPQSLNAYSYAEGNPITSKDPSGLSTKTKLEGAATAAAYAALGVAAAALIIAASPVAIPASAIAAATLAASAIGVASTIADANSNYQAYQSGAISQDQYDYNNGAYAVNLATSVVGIGAAGAVAPEVRPAYVEAPRSILPDRAESTLSKLEANNFEPIAGYKGGRDFLNKEGYLPSTGNENYKEFDVNPSVPGVDRGALRFVVDMESKSVYYTDTHYGSDPGFPFYKINN